MSLIRVCRSTEWWWRIHSHPKVTSLGGRRLPRETVFDIVSDPKVLPLAAEHGGFWFLQRDGLGTAFELHTMFTPEGWGREVTAASHEAFARVFSQGAQLVFTWECGDNRRSRPPLSHGWQVAGEFAYSPEVAAEVRLWMLTHKAWTQSPARRRRCPPSVQQP